MMAEPFYVYRKGEGWVPSIPNSITCRDGVSYIVEERIPEIGERYYTIDSGSPVGLRCPTLAERIEWMDRRVELYTRNHRTELPAFSGGGSTRHYYTFVPV